MADYPGSIYSPRTKANRSGVVYDATKETVIFAEDVVKDDNEIVAIETELGTLPKGSYADVKKRLEACEVNPHRYWLSGRYTGVPVCATTTTFTLAVNKLYAFAFLVPMIMTFNKIAVEVTTFVAGSIRLGVYTDTGRVYPGAKVLDAGTVDTGSNGLKEIAINLTLEPGLYWLVAVSNNTSVLGGRSSAYQYAPIGGSSPYATFGNRYDVVFNFAVLPNNYPDGADGVAATMWVALRKA